MKENMIKLLLLINVIRTLLPLESSWHRLYLTLVTRHIKIFLQTPIAHRFTFVPVNDETILRIIDNLKSKTSYGHDGLSSLLLKTIKKNVSGSLAIIINQSLDAGVFPTKLKLAKVLPILKKDDDTKFSNYRPISILPTISKVFEREIFEQLYNYLNSLNLF